MASLNLWSCPYWAALSLLGHRLPSNIPSLSGGAERQTEREELFPAQDLRGQLAREAQCQRPRPRFWLMDCLTLWSLISPSYKVEAIPVSHFFFFGECEMKYFILKMFINSGFMWDCEPNDYSVPSASPSPCRRRIEWEPGGECSRE